MPKLTLEFALPDDANDARLAQDGASWRAVVEGLDNWFRGQLKYGTSYKEVAAALEGGREYLRAEIEEYGLTLEDLL